MDPSVVDTVQVIGQSGASDLSLWQLFVSADFVVKFVMLLLLAASVWCWSIIFDKIVRTRKLVAQANAFEDAFWSGGSLEDLYDRIGGNPPEPMSAVFAGAMKEWRHASERGLTATGTMRAGLQQRIDRVMQVTIARELGRLERGLTLLASVGSTAPFIGLFGTVWGIMNSFSSIARSQDTSLAVVAPGIAEALFATAIGLVVAIPAVMAYNKLASDVSGIQSTFSSYISVLGNRLARDRAGAHRAAAE